MAAKQRVDCATDAGDDEAPTDAEQRPRQPLMPPPTYDEAVTSAAADHGSKTGVKAHTVIVYDPNNAATVVPYRQVCYQFSRIITRHDHGSAWSSYFLEF